MEILVAEFFSPKCGKNSAKPLASCFFKYTNYHNKHIKELKTINVNFTHVCAGWFGLILRHWCTDKSEIVPFNYLYFFRSDSKVCVRFDTHIIYTSTCRFTSTIIIIIGIVCAHFCVIFFKLFCNYNPHTQRHHHRHDDDDDEEETMIMLIE